ncbi:HDOD domain-containing protein [Photobacterium atrarenae]|uniref:HDOD domain-containing protein n=1 Tax=Photobacterium atrarenae TaxID=865757 RepID=A0ABY5GC40_9GAMM|nr:HDOD domain-containing protein [Photobacterium atrarenae]UTV26780.1 HDOD domain-containing protein [Photobacterium atrarenae]
MAHVSFFWLKPENDKIVKGLQSEFCALVKDAIVRNRLSLPPIPEVLARLQTLCASEETTIRDVADVLLDDPGIAASVIKISNTLLFNRRNVVCHDIQTAVSRLGILRVRDIVTAKSIEELKSYGHFDSQCNRLLQQSALRSRQLAATMAVISQGLIKHPDSDVRLEPEKALLSGLFADIGLFCLLHEYKNYLESGNYIDLNVAKFVFEHCCQDASLLILKHWGFDEDYLEVASNTTMPYRRQHSGTSYLDVARMANHLLMFKSNDEAIDTHHVELDLAGAEVMYDLTNMPEIEFNQQLRNVIKESGF